ncbi:MAG TPA: FHA domain-containing protein [Solirubrobacteraceae bacterium]|nr:FHA domain-containing protein [Solirubrobacteraceae bacterium]
MESLTSGTLAGAGSFRCQQCGYVLRLAASDMLSDCPGCGGHDYARASLFSTGRIPVSAEHTTEGAHSDEERMLWLEGVRDRLDGPGEYLVFEESDELVTVPLTREWTRVGRSLAADVRFDDPTVSRRHALVVRQPDGVRVLDDRSLNGVFVNDERVEWKVLEDGDEILIGRYRLSFISTYAERVSAADAPLQTHA